MDILVVSYVAGSVVGVLGLGLAWRQMAGAYRLARSPPPRITEPLHRAAVKLFYTFETHFTSTSEVCVVRDHQGHGVMRFSRPLHGDTGIWQVSRDERGRHSCVGRLDMERLYFVVSQGYGLDMNFSMKGKRHSIQVKMADHMQDSSEYSYNKWTQTIDQTVSRSGQLSGVQIAGIEHYSSSDQYWTLLVNGDKISASQIYLMLIIAFACHSRCSTAIRSASPRKIATFQGSKVSELSPLY